jgi:diguanylate cyclase (GGDEF)-like protein
MTKKAIVCVDDERLVLISLRDQLSRVLEQDFEIELAEGCEEALALFVELQEEGIVVPLVICDQMMPGMSGDQLLIKIHAHYPQTRKILLTGQTELSNVIQAINHANLYRYITKPWDETDLSLTVKEAIASYFQTQQLIEQNTILQAVNRNLKEQIDRREQMEKRLVHQALHDVLTGLPNRNLLMQRVEKSLLIQKRHPDYLFALLFIDLDRFKVINDSLGHQIGDRLLEKIARKLEKTIRNTDTVARLGGDEFVMLLEPLKSVDDAIRVAQRITSEFQLPLALEGREVFTNASIGVAFGSSEYERGADLLRDADIAMYRAKEKGKGRYEVFDRVMYAEAIARLHLENDLRKALEQQQLQVYYQPIIVVDSLKIKGFEALIRWQHPVKGLISPAQFIPIAEETGLIVSIGEWILQSVAEQIKLWQEQYSLDFAVSVNLSAKQLREADFIAKIDQILAQQGLKGRNLHLELTESMLMENVEELIVLLCALKSRGIEISIDDFGTGYSSLSYLHRFPAQYLKIDRSFIQDICNNTESFKITELIITLAHSLNMSAIAEGVETQAQLDCLRSLGCEYVQGYLFSPPLPAKLIDI